MQNFEEECWLWLSKCCLCFISSPKRILLDRTVIECFAQGVSLRESMCCTSYRSHFQRPGGGFQVFESCL